MSKLKVSLNSIKGTVIFWIFISFYSNFCTYILMASFVRRKTNGTNHIPANTSLFRKHFVPFSNRNTCKLQREITERAL